MICYKGCRRMRSEAQRWAAGPLTSLLPSPPLSNSASTALSQLAYQDSLYFVLHGLAVEKKKSWRSQGFPIPLIARDRKRMELLPRPQTLPEGGVKANKDLQLGLNRVWRQSPLLTKWYLGASEEGWSVPQFQHHLGALPRPWGS